MIEPIDPKLPFLIGIHGHARTGKDTISEYFQHQVQNCYSESFADPLKQACAAAFGISLTSFYAPEEKEVTNAFWKTSPRQIAQFVGTELFREALCNLLGIEQASTFWIRRMYGKLSGEQRGDNDGDYQPDDIVIIPDVRFQNELDFILSNNGTIIHLTRPGADGIIGIPNHASEAGITFPPDNSNIFLIENNSTLEALYEKVDTIIDTLFPITDLNLPKFHINNL